MKKVFDSLSSGKRKALKYPLVVLFALALVVEIPWYFVENIGYTCDSPSYLLYAWGIEGIKIAPLSVMGARTAGYPLMLLWTHVVGVAGGKTEFYTFTGVLILQAGMAVSLSILSYKAIEKYNQTISLLSSIVLIFSFQPFIVSKLIMTEQSFKFLVIFMTLTFCIALQRGRSRFYVLAACVVGVALVMLRPSASIMGLVGFAVLFLARRERRVTTAICSVLFVALVTASKFWGVTFVTPQGDYARAGENVPAERALGGWRDALFYDLYMSNDGKGLAKADGQAAKDLREVLDAFAQERPQDWRNRSPARLFGNYAADPGAWVENLYREQNVYYYVAIKDAVFLMRDLAGDPAIRSKADHLIPRLIRESYLKHPGRLAAMLYRCCVGSSSGINAPITYFRLFGSTNWVKYSPDHGPESRRLAEAVRGYLRDNPDQVDRIGRAMGKDYRGDIDKIIVDQGIDQRLFLIVWEILDNIYGAIQARVLYDGVIKEGVAKGLDHGKIGLLLDVSADTAAGLWDFFFGQHFWNFYNVVECYANSPWEGELIRSGMRYVQATPTNLQAMPGNGDLAGMVDGIVHVVWKVVRLAAAILAIVSCPFIWRSRARAPFLLIAMLVCYHAVVACLFIGTRDERYIDQIYPLLIMLAGFGAIAIRDRVSLRRNDPRILDQ